MSPEEGHFSAQSLGFGCLVIMGVVASGVRLAEPLSILPVLLVYALVQSIFRLSVRWAGRPIRKRNLLFVA